MKNFSRRILILVAALAVLPNAARAQSAAANASTAATAGSPAAKETFFVKLIAPRPTFVSDMTEAEGKLMQQHAEYWAAQFEKGDVLIIGPVLDPKGPFGIVVLRATTEAEARDLAMNDPTVKAGLNHIEVSPMRVFKIKN